MTRLAIIGDGRMGHLLAALAPESGCEVVAVLNRERTAAGLTREILGNADVAVEFTAPSSAARLVREATLAGIPVVSGTTGWDDQFADTASHVVQADSALLWAPNFALGVHLFAKVVAEAARLLSAGAAGFDAHLVETHHVRKVDAPSGTARMLADVAARARSAMPGAAPSGDAVEGRPAPARGEVPITSVRTGHVPGTHELVFDAPFEQVRLVHEARDRRVFAAGALAAARWLVQEKRRGVFTLDDFLEDENR